MLGSNINNLGGTIGDIGVLISKVDDIHNNMDAVVNDISSMEESLNKISTNTDAGLTESFNNLTTKINELKTQVSNLTSLCDLAPLTTKLNDHDTNVIANQAFITSNLSTLNSLIVSGKNDTISQINKNYSQLVTLKDNTDSVKTVTDNILNSFPICETGFISDDAYLSGKMTLYNNRLVMEITGGKEGFTGSKFNVIFNTYVINHFKSIINTRQIYFDLFFYNEETKTYKNEQAFCFSFKNDLPTISINPQFNPETFWTNIITPQTTVAIIHINYFIYKNKNIIINIRNL